MPSHRSRSVYSDDMDAYSTESQWTVTYKDLPRKQPMSMRFISWAAGCPRGANVVKKKTRESDGRSTRSGSSSVSYWGGDPDTQLYWTYSSGGSSSGRSSSGRSSRSGRKGSSRGKHFDGALPPIHLPHHGPGGGGPPMGDPFGPPPNHPPPMNMGGHPGGGFPMPPPPPPGPPMGGGGGGGEPAFFDLTGHNHQGFQGMTPQGGHHMGASADSYYSDDSSDSEMSYHDHQ